ncbi:Sialidase [Cercophora newfieldiana]|uniref:Sialidase n=1 Tax=Cercophora newfieldiana TaxID=92897 RepID=A0AA40CMQ1_9PEZI|nr:Sialidase [Cercophora newfieldiana]
MRPLHLLLTALHTTLSLASADPTSPYPDLRSTGDSVDIAPNYVSRPSAILYRTPKNESGILAVYTIKNYQQNKTTLTTSRSMDGGATWTQLGEVYRGDSRVEFVDHGSAVQFPESGKIVVAFERRDSHGVGGLHLETDAYHIAIYESVDGGYLWKELAEIEDVGEKGDRIGGSANLEVWDPHLRLTRNGTLQLFYSTPNELSTADHLGINIRVSVDQGKSWGPPSTVTGNNKAVEGVPKIVEWNDTVYCAFQSKHIHRGDQEPSMKISTHLIRSSDGGYTWHGRQVFMTATGDRDIAFPQLVNVEGSLVSIALTNVPYPKTVGMKNSEVDLSVHISVDNGQTWRGHASGAEGNVGTLVSGLSDPFLLHLGDREMLLLWVNGGTRPGAGMSERYTLTS